MGTITTEEKKLDFVDCVSNNLFLKSVFPSGLGDVLVGQFGLDQGQFSLNIHVFKKPHKEIAKWGVWGVNYNVIVIKFLGAEVDDINIRNWQKFTPAPLLCWVGKEKLFINCQAETHLFEISCSGLVFQSGSTYTK